MDRNAALARLGLTGAEDSAAVTKAYGQRLSTVQEQLVAAQTDTEREQHQTALSGLVEAYQLLTVPGRSTAVNESSATMLRNPAEAHSTYVRMETGAVLSDRLEVGDLLGQGGMGNVYAARDRLKEEDVAIKVLRQDLVFSTMAKDRFLAEAKVSCNLSHPNIVRVYDVGVSGNNYYLSMERLKGQTLRQRIETHNQEHKDFAVAEVTDIARQLMDALRYAHRYIVHRDIKPENIWLAEDGTVKLMDFGIARAYSSSQLTQTGMTLGTAYYMAPEQRIAAKEVDWRADQYALGVVLYELLTGTIPMGAVKPLDQARRDLPKRYADALMRAMAPKPEERWQSLNELWAEIEAPPAKSSKAALVLVLMGVAAAVAAGAGYYIVKGRGATQPVAATPASTIPSSQVQNAAGTQAASVPGQVSTTATAAAVPSVSGGTSSSGAGAGSGATAGPPGAPPTQPPTAQGTAAALQPSAGAASAGTAALTQQRPEKPARRESGATAPTRVASVVRSDESRRQACITQCERDDGQCRSINRRGKQDCMRAVGFGGSGRITSMPSTRAGAECAYFNTARCEYAGNRDACMARATSRYSECVSILNGSVASRRQDCDDNARQADQQCSAELRECRNYCE